MVEWKKLGEVCKVLRGKRVTKGELKENGTYPVISGGVTPMGYIDSFNREPNTITVSQYGTAGYVDFQQTRFWANDICYSVYPEKDLDNKFLWYALKSQQNLLYAIRNTDATPYSLPADTLNSVPIPIPSLEEQTRIVGILDTFTSAIDNLKEQIAQRRKQYEYYRDQLLDLEGKEGVEMKTLGSFAEIGTGSSNTQDELENGKYPFFVRSQVVRWKNEYEFDETAVITSGDGVGVGKVLHYYEGKYALHQRAYRIKVHVDYVVTKYLFYFMQKDFYSYIMLNAYAASVTSVRKPMLINYPIPIPSLSEQQRIVSILDTFEASISNLEAQLKEREKQYEYYRNKLLTFE